VSGCTANPSTAPAWGGVLTRSAPTDWRDVNQGANSIGDLEMWAAYLNLDTGNNLWVLQVELHSNEGYFAPVLWKGTRPHANGITGAYTRVDGCDATTETVTITEIAP
jgi:hypothetical protein